MRLLGKKRIFILLAVTVLVAGCTWIGGIERKERAYTESFTEVKTEFQLFVEETEQIIAGRDVSFDEFTEGYTQLRMHLSKWNHLYVELRVWEKIENSNAYGETTAGEVFLAVEDVYFNIVHTYYIEDVTMDKVTIEKKCKDIEDMLEGF